MPSIPLHYGNHSVTVCASAFAVDDTDDGLSAPRTGHLVRLAEDALGLAAGYYQVGHYQGRPEAGQRTLFVLSDSEAAAARHKGATVSEAAPAPDWPHPFAIAVEGMRLREVRAFLAEYPDLPDDALVVISPATHHLESEDSPAQSGIDSGAYVPAMSGGGNYGSFWHSRYCDTPRPALSIPAVLLSPSA